VPRLLAVPQRWLMAILHLGPASRGSRAGLEGAAAAEMRWDHQRSSIPGANARLGEAPPHLLHAQTRLCSSRLGLCWPITTQSPGA